MQHIPDNEFDRLFKDRLMDAEVQPSSDLWAHIAPAIAVKKKRNVYVYWSAAATVLVALSAALLFKPQEKIALHAPVVRTTPEITSNLGNDRVNGEVTVAAAAAEKQSNSTVDQANIDEGSDIADPTDNHALLVSQPAEKSLVAMQPTDADDHHISTTVRESKVEITTTVETAVAETALASNSPVTAEPEMTVALNETAEVEQPSKPRIRNAGDLVNFVVDKLDKREQKFVEFRTDDDEGTSLVAINIGPLKINQRRSR